MYVHISCIYVSFGQSGGWSNGRSGGWSVGSTQPSPRAEIRQCEMRRRTRDRDVRAHTNRHSAHAYLGTPSTAGHAEDDRADGGWRSVSTK